MLSAVGSIAGSSVYKWAAIALAVACLALVVERQVRLSAHQAEVAALESRLAQGEARAVAAESALSIERTRSSGLAASVATLELVRDGLEAQVRQVQESARNLVRAERERAAIMSKARPVQVKNLSKGREVLDVESSLAVVRHINAALDRLGLRSEDCPRNGSSGSTGHRAAGEPVPGPSAPGTARAG